MTEDRPTSDETCTREPETAVPGADIVLIGTPATLLLAHRQIGLLGDMPHVVGYVVIGDTAVEDNPDLPSVSGIEGIREARERWGVLTAVVSLPSGMGGVIQAIRTELRRLGMVERFLVPLQEALKAIPPYWAGLADVEGSLSSMGGPRIDMSALLDRPSRDTDLGGVRDLVRGRRVLITGAGGSIGSELARRVAKLGPGLVVLMDRSENALFEIDRQIGSKYVGVPRRAMLHDVVDAELTRRFVAETRPHVIFHAAAHKHVPLMEEHPAAAVVNNLFGTKSIADAALAAGVERFVMVSTDKAVNPTSVMGATKRLAELYVQGLASQGGGKTALSMVRFGNVIGSACSVLQIWSSQLAEGGPITVTDARMTRYFMTIPEAAGLVMQAAALEPARGAPVYVLDMGEPVRILDLARRFVRAHGFEPRVVNEGGDGRSRPLSAVSPMMDIVLTGMRPGEKLHEELAYAAEQLSPTSHPAIRSWRGDARTALDVSSMMRDLSKVNSGANRAQVISVIRRHLPELAAAA